MLSVVLRAAGREWESVAVVVVVVVVVLSEFHYQKFH